MANRMMRMTVLACGAVLLLAACVASAAEVELKLTVDVPDGAKFFAVRSFDDASNRSAMSNVAEVK